MEDSTFSFNLQDEGIGSMQFEPLHEGPAKIKVIGVGGGGGNAVNHMYRQGIHGVEFIVCNTDAKALETSPVPNKIVLGTLGAGNVPERARQLALAHKDEIRQAISDDTQMLFITAGMGGGTGTGAAPVIAEIAKGIELEDEMVKRILVVAIVTEPFSFEGRKRREQAEAGIEELKKYVDAILVINNDKLRTLGGNLSLKQAFSQADDVLLTAAKGIAEIITVSAYVNIDFRDVNTVMENSGTALMGAGEGTGEDRAHQAIEKATTSILLNDNDIRGAQNILLYFSCSPDHQITMDELGEVTDYLTELTGNNGANVIWGIGDDDTLNDELRITLIATGFKQKPGRKVIELPKENNTPDPKNDEPKDEVKTEPEEKIEIIKEEPKDVHEEPVDESGIHVVHKAQTVEQTQVSNPQPASVAPVATVNPVAPSAPVAPVAPVAATVTAASVAPSAAPVSDNPFDSVEAIGGKRVVTLEMPNTTETVQEPVNVAPEPAKAPVQEKNDSFDQIRLIKKTVEQPVNTATVANISTPAPEARIQEPRVQETRMPEPMVQEPQVSKPVNTVVEPIVLNPQIETIKPAPQKPSITDQQITKAFTPMTDEEKVLARAERIKKMNELLRNNPDGPRIIEEMTTEQLTGEPIYRTPHSSESDAARTTIGALGVITPGKSPFDKLPD